MRLISSYRVRLYLEMLTERCLLSNYGLGHVVQVSRGDPFAGCTADDIQHQSGTLYPDSEVEPFLVVDPTNPRHIAGIWQQDRWSGGYARGLVAGISFDGGHHWQETVIPGLSQCSGGSDQRASDPWLSFGPTGDLYAIALTSGPPFSAVVLTKSSDGGLTWNVPVRLPAAFGSPDKEAVTADPSDPQVAYAVWTALGVGEAFSRTTDGGQTWEPTRLINRDLVSGSQIVVLPDGTLVDFFTGRLGLEVMHSTDQGQTWDTAVRVTDVRGGGVFDPDRGRVVRTGAGLGDIAVDPNTGNLYVVWADSRFSGGQSVSIGFTQSTDGGFTWSDPVQVNQTPTDIDPRDQQAFTPTVQVAADGSVGVTYYDFRFNDPQPGVLTDAWFVPGSPDGSGGLTWGNELRLTNESFNLEDAPNANGLFMGDYQGRGSAGNDFLTFLAHPHPGDPASIFFRRVKNLDGRAHVVEGGMDETVAFPIGDTNIFQYGLVASPVAPVNLPQNLPILDLPALQDIFRGSVEPGIPMLTSSGAVVSHIESVHSPDMTVQGLLPDDVSNLA